MRYQLATITVLTGIALMSAMQSPVWQKGANNLTQQCEKIIQSSELISPADTCLVTDDAVTWTEWLRGESRSTQFHFLDFFELVFGDDDSKYRNNDYAKPKRGI